MEDSIFTKIIKREIPADILYEDDHTIAFLDIHPNSAGHTLVVPKNPVQNIFDTDDETLAHVMRTVRKIAPAVRDAVAAAGLNIISNNGKAAWQEVFHMHFHLIPRFHENDFRMFPHREYQAGEAAEIAEQIRSKIG